MPGLQQCSKGLGYHRTAQIIALGLVALLGHKEGLLLRRFDAFRNNPEIEGFAQVYHGTDDARIAWVADHLVHERLVNLQRVDRKLLQVT